MNDSSRNALLLRCRFCEQALVLDRTRDSHEEVAAFSAAHEHVTGGHLEVTIAPAPGGVES